jgi:hypothetical protein
MKYLLMFLLSAITSAAATAHYEWVETPRPPAPHNIKRWVTTAHFDVDTADLAGGVIWGRLVFNDAIRPAPTVTVFIAGGGLVIDPVTLLPVDGGFTTTGTNPYYRTGTLTPLRIASDNPFGGSSTGHWMVTLNP